MSKDRYFIWYYTGREKKDVRVIQDMIHQEQDACSFASVARQIEYKLRICYAEAETSCELRQGVLVDYVGWRMEYPDRKCWRPLFLLQEAKRVGVPLWNGLRHKIDRHLQPDVSIENIRAGLKCGPIIAVFEVRHDFCWDGNEHYRGVEGPVYVVDENGDQTQTIDTHSVVLVGEHEPIIPGETLWVYQNSGGDPAKSTLKNGLNCISHEVIREIYDGVSYAVNVMCRMDTVPEVKQFRSD